MTIIPSSQTGAELWIKHQASENPKSIAALLLPDSIEPISRRLDLELPGASDQQLSDWLIAFEKKHPAHFKPLVYRGDISKLSAALKLDIGNGIPVSPYLEKR